MVFRQLLIVSVVVAATTATPQVFDHLQPPMPHHFSYGVNSPETGDVKEHKQTVSRTGRTDGEYRWLQPNGLYQVVRYYVDGDSGYQAQVSEEPGPGFVSPLSHGVVGHHNAFHPGISSVIGSPRPSHVAVTTPFPPTFSSATAHGHTSLIPLTPTHVSFSSDTRPGHVSSSVLRPSQSFQSFSSALRPGHSFSSISSPSHPFTSFSRPHHSFSSVPRPSRVSFSNPSTSHLGSFSSSTVPHRTSFSTSPGLGSHHQGFGSAIDGGIIHV
ncbi:uncharacterized protein LOC122247009 [Penaeus japonicus]|uniref:uncharacterized protein LOC122247009 n=1 Tax=Penaeus japonicus TaxID=27405 RepID=UPI001C715590|nr:uncharacterized protein LOC122247009 [Penaeus japonicus]